MGGGLKAIFDNDTESEHGRYRAADLFIIYSSHCARGAGLAADAPGMRVVSFRVCSAGGIALYFAFGVCLIAWVIVVFALL